MFCKYVCFVIHKSAGVRKLHCRSVEKRQVCLLGAKSGTAVQRRQYLRIVVECLHRGCETDVGRFVRYSWHSERKGKFAFLREGWHEGYVG